MDRREFLKRSVLLTAGAVVGSRLLAEGTFSKTPHKIVGLQLYSLRDAMKKDVPGTLKKTAKMERYLDPNTELLVRLTKKKDGRRKCEITVPFEGVTLRAEASSDDNLYVCIDQALAKLERQIHKHRTKLQDRFRSDAFKAIDLEYAEEPVAELEEEPKLVRHKTFPVRPMSVEDAGMQMELLGHDFFVFVNADTDRTNVLYQRKDGGLGLLEPEA